MQQSINVQAVNKRYLQMNKAIDHTIANIETSHRKHAPHTTQGWLAPSRPKIINELKSRYQNNTIIVVEYNK